MSGFTTVEKGTIKIVHHSTSSLIQVIIKDKVEVEQGKFEDFDKIVWLDYTEFSDLKEAIGIIDNL